MNPTIDGLLSADDLRLRLATAPAQMAAPSTLDPFSDTLSRERRAAPIYWVHSSDLEDPTEFLSKGTLLLTDGAQFGLEYPERYDYNAYIERLIQAGVVGLGFATQFLHDGTPAALISACVDRSFPLLEVPDRIPFIAIIRRVADALAEERTLAMEWSLAAQRSIAHAALKPDGISAILVQLERWLSCRVALFDGAGRPLPVPSALGISSQLLPRIVEEVATVLRRGRRASSRLESANSRVTIQTLGQPDGLRGALVIEHERPLDRSETELVTSVIAIASLALEQSRALDASRRALRAGLLELIFAGGVDIARQTATAVWGGFPSFPLTVAALDASVSIGQVRDAMEILADESRGEVFYADRAPYAIVLVDGPRREEFLELAVRLGRPVGLSSEISGTEVSRGADEALTALEHAIRVGLPAANFEDFLAGGVLGLLHSGHADRVARRLIEPLARYDDDNAAALRTTLRVWLDEDCSWERASRRLGVHRHTLRSRIHQCGTILGLDLGTFEGRLEAWGMLRFTAGSSAASDALDSC